MVIWDSGTLRAGKGEHHPKLRHVISNHDMQDVLLQVAERLGWSAFDTWYIDPFTKERSQVFEGLCRSWKKTGGSTPPWRITRKVTLRCGFVSGQARRAKFPSASLGRPAT